MLPGSYVLHGSGQVYLDEPGSARAVLLAEFASPTRSSE